MKKILIIDDNKESLLLFKLSLKNLATYIQSDSRKAIESFKEIRPSIILLDCFMPYIDGFEIARKIRLIDKYCKIIMVSATHHEQDKLKDADLFLLKPIDVCVLRKTIEDMLQKLSLSI